MLQMLNCNNLQTPESTKPELSLEELELIRAAVVETIRTLRKSGLLRRYDDVAYSEISGRLYAYYRDPSKDPALREALDKIKTDPYYDILPQFYQQKLTIDWIAEGFRCEFITISRNKKRLCLKIHDILEAKA